MRRNLRAFHVKQEITTMDIGLVALAVCCVCCTIVVALITRAAPRHDQFDGWLAAYQQGREDERREQKRSAR